MRQRTTPSGNGIAVGVDADCSVRTKMSRAQRLIEQNACGREIRQLYSGPDDFNAIPESKKPFGQQARTHITSTSSADVCGNRGDKVKPIHNSSKRLRPGDDSAYLCWYPELFLTNDFTVLGVSMERGRRQEPRTRRIIS